MATSELLVTPGQRDRAVEILQEMYADERLARTDFDRRLDRALTARTRAELNTSFEGLAGRPVPAQAPAAYLRPQPIRHPGGGRGMGAIAHWLGCPSFFVGPAIVAATVGQRNPAVRRHAIEAVNFQLTVLGVFMVLGIVAGSVPGPIEVLFPLVGVAWFLLTGVAGLATLVGNDFRYPFTVRFLR